MRPRVLLQRARKACTPASIYGGAAEGERDRRARVVLAFCERAHATPMVHSSGSRTGEFGSCVEWAVPPPYLNTACDRFSAGLREVGRSPGGLARLLAEMAQREL